MNQIKHILVRMSLGMNAARTHIRAAEKPVPGKKRIICIGDSITYGAGVSDSREKDAWTYVLGRLLGDHYQVLNYGVNGTTAQSGADFPYGRFGFLKDAEKSGADIVLLMLGTNDSKSYNWNPVRYRQAMLKLISRIQSMLPDADIIVMLPPKAFPGKNGIVNYDIQDTVIKDEILPILRTICRKRKLPAIDLYNVTEGHPEYFDDGVHPNGLGNRMIAQHLRCSIPGCP